jgi:transposase-like protein
MKKNLYLSTTASEALKIQGQQQAAEQAKTLMHATREELQGSFDRFCLAAGVQALQGLMEEDARAICGDRYERHGQRQGRRWGKISGKIGYHGGRIDLERPRLRDRKGRTEIDVPSWTTATHEDWLGAWAMNQMLINVSTRKFGRSVRLPEGDVETFSGDGTSKSAASRHFVALSSEKMKAWMASDLSQLDLLAIQIDGLHATSDIMLVGAVGIDSGGHKHPLGVVEGATENTVTVQALLDNLIERGLDPSVIRLFIVDGAKALSRAIRKTFGKDTPIQRCQIHKARNILERLPDSLRPSVRMALRQVWAMEDADKAEQMMQNLARRLEKEAPGIAASILEGLDEILCVARMDLPHALRRSLCCTNIIENMNSTIRRVTRNVKRWRHAEMALRWAAAGMMEASKGFKRLKAYKQLPQLKAALQKIEKRRSSSKDVAGLATTKKAA